MATHSWSPICMAKARLFESSVLPLGYVSAEDWDQEPGLGLPRGMQASVGCRPRQQHLNPQTECSSLCSDFKTESQKYSMLIFSSQVQAQLKSIPLNCRKMNDLFHIRDSMALGCNLLSTSTWKHHLLVCDFFSSNYDHVVWRKRWSRRGFLRS